MSLGERPVGLRQARRPARRALPPRRDGGAEPRRGGGGLVAALAVLDAHQLVDGRIESVEVESGVHAVANSGGDASWPMRLRGEGEETFGPHAIWPGCPFVGAAKRACRELSGTRSHPFS